MTFLAAPILGGLASAAGSSILGGLFGGGNDKPTAPIQNFTPTGINAGGLSTSLSGGNIGVTATGSRPGLVRSISDAFGDQAGTIAGLRDRVTPGFSDLRRSRLAEIENARQNAIGNLRDNMARRRTLGSSFGQDALVRAENEFGQAKDRVAAESFLQELELTNQLTNQEFEARRASFQTGLDELNLEAELASKLASSASQQLGANARVEADLNAKSAAGAGKFFGEIAQPIGKAIGDGASKFFSGFNPVAGTWGT